MFYKKLRDNVQCYLCPHYCLIRSGERGKCGVRENRDGLLYSLVYEQAYTTAIDPIEKKPLFHFMPGSLTFSMTTVGCNLFCQFCQNWQIARPPEPEMPITGSTLTPEQIVDRACLNGCQSIAYTYTEPTIFFEYAYETAKRAHEKNLKNVFVSNGFITAEAIDTISPYLDAINIDLKGFSEEYYREICGGRLQPILDAIKRYYENNVWVEITTLIVPGYSDNEQTLSKIANFIHSIDDKIPWHVSRFHPCYEMQNVAVTDVETIEKAISIGKAVGLKYTYAGNLPGNKYVSTFCPNCQKKIIDRTGFVAKNMHLDKDRCEYCHERIDLVLD